MMLCLLSHFCNSKVMETQSALRRIESEWGRLWLFLKKLMFFKVSSFSSWAGDLDIFARVHCEKESPHEEFAEGPINSGEGIV
jgi:hypothetical protein